MLTREVSNDEIKVVIFSNLNNKPPRPNDFIKEFFVFFWDIVRNLTLTIKYFFDKGKLLQILNHCFLSIIPKTQDAKSFEYSWSISLYNFVYKCIFKVIIFWLAHTLPSLISLNHSTFLKDGLINENILLTHELVRNFHHCRGPKRFCIKVDLKKAFDKVHWDFFLLVVCDLGQQHLDFLDNYICHLLIM